MQPNRITGQMHSNFHECDTRVLADTAIPCARITAYSHRKNVNYPSKYFNFCRHKAVGTRRRPTGTRESFTDCRQTERRFEQQPHRCLSERHSYCAYYAFHSHEVNLFEKRSGNWRNLEMLAPATASFSVRWKTWESTCAGEPRSHRYRANFFTPEFSKPPRSPPQGPRKFSNFAPRIEYNRITRSRRLISRNSKIIPRAIPTWPLFYLRESQRSPTYILFSFPPVPLLLPNLVARFP